MENLKPCPLCGGEAFYNCVLGDYGYTSDIHTVKCMWCGLQLSKSNGYKDLKDAVIKAWNTRQTDQSTTD